METKAASTIAEQYIKPKARASEWQLLLARMVGVILSGGLLIAAFPPYGWRILIPFAIAGLLLSLHQTRPRHAFYLGFLAGLVFYGGTLYWLNNLFGAATLTLIALMALFLGLFGFFYTWIQSKITAIPFWLLAAIIWTAIEIYRSEWFALAFGWMGLGYAFVNSTLIASVASYIGSYGITFVVMLIGGLLAKSICLIYQGKPKQGSLLFALLTVLFLGSALVYLPPTKLSRPMNVRLIQANAGETDDTAKLISQSGVSKPDLVLFPEYFVPDDPYKTRVKQYRIETFRQAAINNNLYVVFGGKSFPEQNSDGFENTAFVIEPTGNLAGKHVKNHPVHFIEDGSPGKEANAVATHLGKLGIGICFDMDFPDVARRLAQSGAEVFIIPNMDPGEWGPIQQAQHRLMFQMRAIENGRWLARADVAGGTSIVAPSGHETARVDTSDTTVLDGQVGRIASQTFYTKLGWLFAPLCLIVFSVLVLNSIFFSFKQWNKATSANTSLKRLA